MLNENHSQRIVVAGVYVSAMFMSVLDTTIVTVALPAVAREFRVPAAVAGSVSIAYLVALTVVIPVSGWLGDRFGGRRVLLAAIALFTLGSALCGISASLPALIVFSAIQGVGGAIMLPVGLAMLFRVYPPAQRLRLSSTLALITALGPALGPILGGVFTTYLSWRFVFFVNVPIGLAAIVWGLARMDTHRQPHPGRFDVAGLALSALGLGTLMFGVAEGPTRGWSNPIVLASIAVGVALLIALVPVELRREHPLIAFRLLGNRLLSTATGLYALGSIAYIGALYLVALFVQEALGQSAIVSGLTSVASAVGVMVGGQLVTRALYPRLGPRILTACGLLLVAVSLAVLALVADSGGLWIVRVDLFVLGLGVAAVFIPAQTISMATIPGTSLAKASPIFNAGKQLGSAIGVALLSTILLGLRVPESAGSGAGGVFAYRVAFLVAAAIALASVAVALRIRNTDLAAPAVEVSVGR